MIVPHSIRQVACWLMAGMMCLPASLAYGAEARTQAEVAPRPVTAVRDISLAPGGLLVGRVLDKTMTPVRGAKVAVQSQGHTAAVTETDADGVFAVAGLRGGVHEIVTERGVENCRLWSTGTAPPHAESHLRFVPGQSTVVRGQWIEPQPTWKQWVNPWVVGGVVATAVAVPVLLHNLDDDDDSGS
jgi:hypothetical protein